MESSTILAAIEAAKSYFKEDSAVYAYPSIPDEVLAVHKKKYLELAPDEKVLVLVGKCKQFFTGFCITDKRLIVRVENGSVLLGSLTSIFRETIDIPLNEIKTLSAALNINSAMMRILVNGQYVGFVYQNSASSGLKRSTNNTFEAVDALFKEMTLLSGGDLASSAKSTAAGKKWIKQYRKSGLLKKYFLGPVISHYVDFKGVATRSEYWHFALFFMIIVGAVSGLFSIFFDMGTAVYYLLSLVLLLPSLGIMVRRMHDIGKSGKTVLVSLIPVVGPMWLLVLLCRKGNEVKMTKNSASLSDIAILSLCGMMIIVAAAVALTKLENGNYGSNEIYDSSVYDDSSDDISDNAEDISDLKKRINRIYKYAFSGKGDAEKKFFSRKLYGLWKDEQKASEEYGIGAIEFDIWSLSQDPADPQIEIGEINCMGALKYSVTLMVVNKYEDRTDKQAVVLLMVKERGDWFIGDIYFSFGGEAVSLSEILQGSLDE